MKHYSTQKRLADHLSFNWQYYCAIFVLLAIILYSLYFNQNRIQQVQQVSSWPTTVATIIQSEVSYPWYKKSQSIGVEMNLVLQYEVKGITHKSLFVKNRPFSDHFDYARLEKGQQIVIHYSTKDPETISLYPWFL